MYKEPGVDYRHNIAGRLGGHICERPIIYVICHWQRNVKGSDSAVVIYSLSSSRCIRASWLGVVVNRLWN